MGGSLPFAGVALLALAAPFELTEPLLRLPRQSLSSLESVVLLAFAAWGIAIASSRRVPEWRTPITLPWIAVLIAMAVASIASPVSRMNALHMTGRVGAAFLVYLLAVNSVTTPTRLRVILVLAVSIGVLVSSLAILEYMRVGPVLTWLRAFRPQVMTVGAQVRAGGPLQYPTIASMYLEVVFAFGLGVLLGELDASRPVWVAAAFIALVVIGEGITVTFTRAGLITMVASLALVGAIRVSHRGADTGAMIVAALAIVVAILFVSSRSTHSMWLRFTSEGQESWYRAAIEAPRDVALPTGRIALVPITVTNTGRLPWTSDAEPPILVSYHWLPANVDGFVTFDGARTPFAAPVPPDATASIEVHVLPPRQPGRYRLEWDLVQEGRLWFSTEAGAIRTMSRATVTGDAADGPLPATTPPSKPTMRPGRLELWRAAARMVAAHPLLGVGPDNFRLSYGSYAGIASADPRTHSNNMYLEMLAGGGLLVGAAFAWLLWRTIGCVAALVRHAAAGGVAAAAGLAAAAIAIALHATVDSFLSFAPTYVLFSLTLACAVACARGAEDRLDAHRV